MCIAPIIAVCIPLIGEVVPGFLLQLNPRARRHVSLEPTHAPCPGMPAIVWMKDIQPQLLPLKGKVRLGDLTDAIWAACSKEASSRSSVELLLSLESWRCGSASTLALRKGLLLQGNRGPLLLPPAAPAASHRPVPCRVYAGRLAKHGSSQILITENRSGRGA